MSTGGAHFGRDEHALAVAEEISNTGRWGPDDELGTLNYITPAKRVQAAGLVRHGIVVSLAHPLMAGGAPGEEGHIQRRMMYNRTTEPTTGTPPAAADHFAMETHQQGVTHLDCVSHIGGWDGSAYNGRCFEGIAGEEGLGFGSVYAQRDGIVSRGVLLDVAAARGVDWLDSGHEITSADLDAAAQHAGLQVSSGDVVVVRAGTDAREAAQGPDPLVAGPGPDAARWMHRHEVAVYTGDAPEHITTAAALILGRLPDDAPARDIEPGAFPLPFHQLVIPSMGLVLLDHARVEELAQTCRELSCHEFLFVAAPLVMPGGSGSPVNPLAVF
ncbi:MAG: cyclase family protein [Euzebya sp.]